ncbi:hypothetical protein FN846DRAFT_977503 [Sphaerosporella brunnea]|uniref:Uncharacterized protein n=1 Tax=Sphaerosporella brunnea TaxID=1250544 RepID=A0A5J5EEH5_9PEZI|nr:hypothetical protein FN846DRAFT_977503 [Sphaerosporella brunnea]
MGGKFESWEFSLWVVVVWVCTPSGIFDNIGGVRACVVCRLVIFGEQWLCWWGVTVDTCARVRVGGECGSSCGAAKKRG